jgi:hypothetical protein
VREATLTRAGDRDYINKHEIQFTVVTSYISTLQLSTHHISLDHITDVTKVEEVLKEIYGEGNFEATWTDAAVNVETDKEEPVNLVGALQEHGC